MCSVLLLLEVFVSCRLQLACVLQVTSLVHLAPEPLLETVISWVSDMDSEDEMLDAWAGTSDGEFVNEEEEDEDSDALPSDGENYESDYGFDYSNADDLHPSSRLPQVFLDYSSSGS